MQNEIKRIMKKYNLSREDVASKLGVTFMTVYRWEKGLSTPRSRMVLRAFDEFKKELTKK